jgi:hypothetical protein
MKIVKSLHGMPIAQQLQSTAYFADQLPAENRAAMKTSTDCCANTF